MPTVQCMRMEAYLDSFQSVVAIKVYNRGCRGASEVKLVIEDEDDTGRGRIGHAGLAARALSLERYPRERENGIITVVRTFCLSLR